MRAKRIAVASLLGLASLVAAVRQRRLRLRWPRIGGPGIGALGE